MKKYAHDIDISNYYPITILVGNTGFVGQNLIRSYKFSAVYHSVNVKEAYGSEPDLLVYAGVSGTKFIADRFPQKDKICIDEAIENIKGINPKKLVLISTIDVYDFFGMDEDYSIESSSFGTYGNNRLRLEKWVQTNVTDPIIIRLPGLYGYGLKKNFIYDLIYIIPQMLDKESYQVNMGWKDISIYYKSNQDGYYHFNKSYMSASMRNLFLQAPINALSFTDSRSIYQFFNLAWLWNEICWAVSNDIMIFNIATPPVSANELHREIFYTDFFNGICKEPPQYDMRTKYGTKEGYLYPKEYIFENLIYYVDSRIKTI